MQNVLRLEIRMDEILRHHRLDLSSSHSYNTNHVLGCEGFSRLHTAELPSDHCIITAVSTRSRLQPVPMDRLPDAACSAPNAEHVWPAAAPVSFLQHCYCCLQTEIR